MKHLHTSVLIVAALCFAASLSYGFLFSHVNHDTHTTPAVAEKEAPRDESGCISCHAQLAGKAGVSAALWERDTHHQAGLSCVSCHGGNPSRDITMANYQEAHKDIKDAKGKVIVPFIARGDAKKQMEWCGSCHESPEKMKTYKLSKSIEKIDFNINAVYAASSHGVAALKEGNAASASCVSCHGAHGAMTADNPLSLTYPKNIANMCGTCHASESYMAASLEKKGKSFENHIEAYMESVHAKGLYVKNDLTSPTCNDCHGKHGNHPEEVADVTQACNSCHASIASAYSAGPHASAYLAAGNNGCISCHGSPNGHRIANWGHEKVGIQEGAQCLNCHNANVPDPPAYKVALDELMKEFNATRLIVGDLKTAQDSVRYAASRGLYSRAKYLAAVPTSLEDSLRLAWKFFEMDRYSIALDTKQDSLNARKLVPALLRYVKDEAKLATLKTADDSLALAIEVADYANSYRKYQANLRAMGSAAKLHAYLIDFEKTYKESREFFEAREKEAIPVSEEMAYLEELKRQADAAGGNHHIVRAALFEAKMAEGFAVKDSVKALVHRTEQLIATRATVLRVTLVLVGLLIIGLGLVVSRLNDENRDRGR
ncbi:MAG: cytochrome c3 family protein [Chloroherpetonaceae bacterium]|nr:cytochrome c3 family protein [Chloroherpetonaceae bacterium]